LLDSRFEEPLVHEVLPVCQVQPVQTVHQAAKVNKARWALKENEGLEVFKVNQDDQVPTEELVRQVFEVLQAFLVTKVSQVLMVCQVCQDQKVIEVIPVLKVHQALQV
jgi:hypothetical protein